MRVRIGLIAAALLVGSQQPALAQKRLPPKTDNSRVEQAIDVVADADANRLLTDKNYAAQILESVETLRASSIYSGSRQVAIDNLRMLALMGSGRTKEAHDQAVELLKVEPNDPSIHYFALLLATDLDGDLALAQLEQADRQLKDNAARAELAKSIDTDFIYFLRRPLNEANDKAKLARSARALLNLGVPGPNYPQTADSFRLDIAEDLLARGDIDGARNAARSLQMVGPVLSTLVARRWAPSWNDGEPGARVKQAIAATDEATEKAMRADPADTKLLLMRAQFLRSVAREEDALRLLKPKADNFDWVKQEGEYGYWIVNETAYSLVSLKREKEAVALMDRLINIGLKDNPILISMAINAAEIMLDAGEYRRAADYSAMLAEKHAGIASPFGRMWMWSGAACGQLLAGNSAAASRWLAKVKAGEKDNPAAVTRTLLCANDADGAAASIIRRLGDKDPDDMLKAVQNYTLASVLSPSDRILDERLRQVLARPDVQAAINRHGRVIDLPLSKIYWGMF